MSKEYFWGDSLTSNKRTIIWHPSLEDEDEDEDDIGNEDSDGIQHILFLKQAVLGVTAKDGERNVVEIETENLDGQLIKQPLLSLRMGLNESSLLDIALQPPAKFTLSHGAGPVHLNGQHMIEINEDDFEEEAGEEEEDLEEVEEEEEEEEEENVDVKASPNLMRSKKRQLSTTDSVKKTKMAKLEKDVEEDEDDEDGNDEDDEDVVEMEDEMVEDVDESEEEEETVRSGSPGKQVKNVKGKKAQANASNGTSATAKGDNKSNAKETVKASAQKGKGKKKTFTIEEIKKKIIEQKGKGKKKTFTIEEIKKKIIEGSSMPKKEDKFKNMLRTNFHVTEQKKIQDLWSWFKSTKLSS